MPFTMGGIDAFLNMALKQQSPEACDQRRKAEQKAEPEAIEREAVPCHRDS